MAGLGGFDLQGVISQIAANPDLISQLQGMNPTDNKGIGNALDDAGISVPADQISGVVGALGSVLGNIDAESVLKGVDLSDGFDMKDIQGLMGGFMGGKR
jgi:hypothetical protein